MLTKKTLNENFKIIMYPIAALGVVTNVYIIFVLFYVDAKYLFLSPTIGNLLFILLGWIMKRNIISPYLAYIIAAYATATEVVIHTYYLGWNSGFYYYLCILPLIFLLNSTWRVWVVITFNSSLILLTLLLVIFFYDESGYHYVSIDKLNHLNLFNQLVIGVCVLTIMIFFSFKNNEKDDALIRANNVLGVQNYEIITQKNHLEILLKEVHHRVKNNLQVISSLLSLQKGRIDDQEIITVLNESRRRVEAIALIHHKLYNDEVGNTVDFKSYLNDLIASQEIIQSKIKCQLHSIALMLNLDTAVPLGLIVSEMLTNSLKYAFEDQRSPIIRIHLNKKENRYQLIIHDNGIGLPEDFTLNGASSLGIEIITALVDQIDGEILFENDNGAKFIIYFSELQD